MITTTRRGTTRRTRRRTALLLAATMAWTLLPTGPAIAASSAANAAADWVAREYDAPDSEIAQFGTGTLIDAMVALAATGTEQDTALDMLDELAGAAADYTGDGDAFNPGAAGKVVHVLEVYGEDPDTYIDGRAFETELRASMQTSGDDAGRFGETSVFSQALAVLGLSMTDDGAPTEAVAWLAAAQCDEGDFTFDGTCPGSGDADTTGLAALALIAGGETSVSAEAVAWLESIQAPSGAIPGYGSPNANSTALAGQAFVASGETALAASAEGFLESLQFPQSAPAADAGGLRYLETDTAANTFATIQGIWAMGTPPLFQLVAPKFEFGDTSVTVFAEDILWIAAAGITRGCNPPANDSFCPEEPVSRGQMAAFLQRALELPEADDPFLDTAGSVFAGDITAIAAAGITRGCNPPANDRFCPDDVITRGQMAAFLVRAFDLGPGADGGFTDVAGSVFADDIDAIAAAGITRGCNPPANDSFCPDEPVTRGQMAAFLRRALSS